MPTLKVTEASLSYVQCTLYLVSSSINVSVFKSTRPDTFWTDLRGQEILQLKRQILSHLYNVGIPEIINYLRNIEKFY